MSNTPLTVDLPHRLGAEEAKRRIGANIGSLAGQLPAGAQVRSAWQGDRLDLGIAVIGQQLEAAIDVQESLVRVSVLLPPALAFFGKAIEAGLRRSAPQLLEDRSKR
jgi:putative polyhydroxyalkanoic acid system protein